MSTATDDISTLLQTMEDLHPDLRNHLEDNGKFQSLKHPLVFSIFHFDGLNAYANRQYEQKLEQVKRAVVEKNWSHVIWLHERPYRMSILQQYASQMDDKSYWENLGSAWSDSENIWQFKSILPHLINADRPGREAMMDESDRELFDALPDEICVFRGHEKRNRNGWSWTLSYSKAVWFSRRFHVNQLGKERGAMVTRGVIKKDKVIAALTGRNEAEIVCDPRSVRDKTVCDMEIEYERPRWMQEILNRAKIKYNCQLKGVTHGPPHWEKVERNAIAIAGQTPGADMPVCRLFSILHDCCRENDNHDRDHGKRAAEFAQSLYDQSILRIDRRQLRLLKRACAAHENGHVTTNPTIGCCWDADRMDLIRVGVIPDRKLFSTEAGKALLWRI